MDYMSHTVTGDKQRGILEFGQALYTRQCIGTGKSTG